METSFERLETPTPEIVEHFNTWENDPLLVPLTRPNKDREALERQETVTDETLAKRLENHAVYLIRVDGTLVGEMNYQIDPDHLYKKEPGTAWIGITIGEAKARGKGLGALALAFLDGEIRRAGLLRIELGVFEFNLNAIKLYTRLGYKEIGRLDAFTYWDGRMWQDIRMEKYL
jgi:RimJ/RimL family protein N-acetyltransferase